MVYLNYILDGGMTGRIDREGVIIYFSCLSFKILLYFIDFFNIYVARKYLVFLSHYLSQEVFHLFSLYFYRFRFNNEDALKQFDGVETSSISEAD